MDLEIAAKRLAELGNVTRLHIIRLLVRADRNGLIIGEIQNRLGIPASTLAFHLRGLVGAGLIHQIRDGRMVRCRPNMAALNETLAFVSESCGVVVGPEHRGRRRGYVP